MLEWKRVQASWVSPVFCASPLGPRASEVRTDGGSRNDWTQARGKIQSISSPVSLEVATRSIRIVGYLSFERRYSQKPHPSSEFAVRDFYSMRTQ